MYLTYSSSYSHSHFSNYACSRNGYSFVSGSFGTTRNTQYHVLPYAHQKKPPKPRWAYSSSYKREFSEKATEVFRGLGDRVRGYFSRNSKPIDHLGGLDPEKRLFLIDDIERDLERSPKPGNTFENMDVGIY